MARPINQYYITVNHYLMKYLEKLWKSDNFSFYSPNFNGFFIDNFTIQFNVWFLNYYILF